MTTRITSENITDATVTATDLAAGAGAIQWQAVKTSDFTAAAGKGYFVNTTGGEVTVTLPGSPSVGDTVVLKDYARTWATNQCDIATFLRDGASGTRAFVTNGETITLVYMDGTKGWSLINEDTTTNLNPPPAFIAATGGTVATSGDYKIHTFVGDGNFVVSSIGNAPVSATGGPDAVSYLVVAGGGMGASSHGGGGGAGGFREGRVIAPEHTASPLVAPGLTISATTYPITVGAGGAGGTALPSTTAGRPGSNSAFSTITSAGGGSIARYNVSTPVAAPTKDGGSGAAASGHPDRIGQGNTPPVSPPQGTNGGAGPGAAPIYYGGGGGGATVNGTTGGPNSGGCGGAGATTHITGSPVAYAGGGGGGIYNHPIGAPGGTGGGGTGSPAPGGYNPVSNGGANTGGGGGGGAGAPGGAPNEGGGSGGKGIVVIKYKFQ